MRKLKFKKLSNISRVTELVNGGAGIQIQVCETQKLVLLMIMLWCLPIKPPVNFMRKVLALPAKCLPFLQAIILCIFYIPLWFLYHKLMALLNMRPTKYTAKFGLPREFQ